MKAIADPGFRFKKTDLVHLSPLILNIIIKWGYYFSSADVQIRFLSEWLDGSLMRPGFYGDAVSRLVFNLHFVVCTLLAIRIYRKNKDKILQASPFGKIYLSWVQLLTYPLPVSYIVWIVCSIFIAAGYPMRPFYFAMNLFVASLVFLLVYRVFTQPEILFMARAQKAGKKYNTSYLTPPEAATYFKNLLNLMEEKEAYLDPGLTLAALADQLTIHKNYLSQIINERTGRTFNDFVNSYRVEKLKKLFRDPSRKDATILDLAFEVGFNSKTPFNTAFKKHTGKSPTAYRNRYLKQSETGNPEF